jgi:ubiquinone/menaquinone biosynthesis C-methylase UbiE
METQPAALKQWHEKGVLMEAEGHNMAKDPDEAYYLRQYWHWIEKRLHALAGKEKGEPLQILDLGCGQGRLTLSLAKWCSKRNNSMVAGVDISPAALASVRQAVSAEGLMEFAQFVEDDLLRYLKKTADSSFQVVVCTEVLYMVPDYKSVLREVHRVLVPGGLFIGAFRGRYYNILNVLSSGVWSAMAPLLASTEGYPWGPPTRFSWFNVEELKALLVDYGFHVLACHGIGVCSGIEGDPLAKIARPSLLTGEEREALLLAELALADTMADCGRYILVESLKKMVS